MASGLGFNEESPVFSIVPDAAKPPKVPLSSPLAAYAARIVSSGDPCSDPADAEAEAGRTPVVDTGVAVARRRGVTGGKEIEVLVLGLCEGGTYLEPLLLPAAGGTYLDFCFDSVPVDELADAVARCSSGSWLAIGCGCVCGEF